MFIFLLIESCLLILSFIYGMRAELAASRCRDIESFCNAFLCIAFILCAGGVAVVGLMQPGVTQ
jgi:uncharacterized membrane protein YqgA involved in biofilm formation